jgi:hypothetical protein
MVIGPFQESERSGDGFGTGRLLPIGRNVSGILSGSNSVVNGSPARIDVEEGTERPEQPADFGG